MKKHVLVIASTFPSSDSDPVPAFVKDQVIAMKKADPELSFSVLAPHDYRSATKSFAQHAYYDEYRFHYAWPFSLEVLAGRGIVPTLKKNPLLYMLVPALFIGEAVSLYRLTKKLSPDIIYAHWFTPQAIAASFVGRLTKTPFVFTTHASDVSIWRKIPFGSSVVRGVVKRAVGITAVSSRSMRKLTSFFGTESEKHYAHKTHLIPMGTDTNTRKSSAKELEQIRTHYTIGDRAVLLFVGRLAEKKGVAYLLRGFADLKKTREESTLPMLLIAGDGPLRAELETQAHELGLEADVRFVGYATGELKDRLFSLADIVIVPSIITDDGDAEGLPVVLMEALSAGKICIATRESGADDILHNAVDGYLINQRSESEIADSLNTALTMSPKAREHMTAAAQQCAQQFSWDTIAKQHITKLFKEPFQHD